MFHCFFTVLGVKSFAVFIMFLYCPGVKVPYYLQDIIYYFNKTWYFPSPGILIDFTDMLRIAWGILSYFFCCFFSESYQKMWKFWGFLKRHLFSKVSNFKRMFARTGKNHNQPKCSRVEGRFLYKAHNSLYPYLQPFIDSGAKCLREKFKLYKILHFVFELHLPWL